MILSNIISFILGAYFGVATLIILAAGKKGNDE